MNKENLIKMAEYLEAGKFRRPFDMISYCSCVVGHSLAVIEEREKFEFHQVACATDRMFGIESPDMEREATPTWMFCFSATWGTDAKAAAARLRYVALHGSAPSQDQWEKYKSFPVPVVEVEDEECLSTNTQTLIPA